MNHYVKKNIVCVSICIIAIIMRITVYFIVDQAYTRYDLGSLDVMRFCEYYPKSDETVICEYYPRVGEVEEIGRLDGRFYRGIMSADGEYIIGALQTEDADLEIVEYYLEDGRVEVCIDQSKIEGIVGEELEKVTYGGYNIRLLKSDPRKFFTYDFSLYDMCNGKTIDLHNEMKEAHISRLNAITDKSIWGTNVKDELRRYDIASGNSEVVMEDIEEDCAIYGDGERIAHFVEDKRKISVVISSAYDDEVIKMKITRKWPERSCEACEMDWSDNGEYLFYTIRARGFFGAWSTRVRIYSMSSGRTYPVINEFFSTSSRNISFIQQAE